jgi:hypothetical protein
MTTTPIDQDEPVNVERSVQLAEVIDTLTATGNNAAAVDEQGRPVAFAAGTFAMYPMRAGGIMVTMKIDSGPLAGPAQHVPIPAGIIRAMAVIAGGGSKVQALKAMMRREVTAGG